MMFKPPTMNKTIEERAKEWELKGRSYQIADTGDYDGHWEITNGEISLYSNDYDEDKEVLQEVVDKLNGKSLAASTEAEGWKAVELLREYRDMLLTPLNKEVPLKEVMKMGEWFKRVEKLLGSLPSNSNQ